jgi:tetratricopeptide (TPR) repeat protein
VNRALALEPDLAEGHAVVAGIQMAYEHDWRAAGDSVRRALELAPGNVLVLRRAGVLGMTEGRLEDTIDLYRRALEQDPLSAGTYHNLAMVLHAAGRLDEAEAACRKGLELTPQRTATRARLALVLLALGRNGEAAKAVADEPDEAFRLWALTIMQHVLGCAEQSEHALRDLIEAYADDSAYQIAEACGARGEADAAFRWLERAYAQRDGGLLDLKTSPYFRSLHADPRWDAFLKKMGFEG